MTYYEFKSSILRGGSIITPDIITIDDDVVTWRRNRGASRLFLASSFKTIPRNKISSVEIYEDIIGCNVVITTYSGTHIEALHFSKSDAQEIRRILLYQKNSFFSLN